MVFIVFRQRLITYGTSNLSRYLNYKHGKRFCATPPKAPVRRMIASKEQDKQTVNRMKKIFPYTIAGIGFLGVYFTTRFSPSFPFKPTKLEIKVYSLLPLRSLSRLWGVITSMDLPVFLRPKIYSYYAHSFGVNMDECAIQDLTQYKNLSEFFIRPLKEDCRPIDRDRNCMVSPADGRILACGKITNNKVDQVKGATYSLPEFLGRPNWKDFNVDSEAALAVLNKREVGFIEKITPDPQKKILARGLDMPYLNHERDMIGIINEQFYLEKIKENKNTDLYQCVVYLAPGDYHRFHSPVSWTVYFRRHIYGTLLSVNPAIASWISNLFSMNERAAYIGSWRHGFFSLTAVGATNVGSIKVTFDPALKTNTRWAESRKQTDFYFGVRENPQYPQEKISDKHIYVKKGDLFGEFRLGSTIVLIFEAPKNFKFVVKSGDRIKYGERIGQLDE